MRILVACEFSGIVRDAFIARGYDAVSCDLLPSERPGPHIVADASVIVLRSYAWNLIVAFPPCTHLAVSGARWFKDKEKEQAEAVEFVRRLMCGRAGRIAIENPIGVLSTRLRKPDQIIQPWQFGHPETKATCLWLKNLPQLKPRNPLPRKPAPLLEDNEIAALEPRVHLEPPGPDRWKNRSRTVQGIADAMAEQWGSL